MLQYSSNAKEIRPLFYHHYNDIEIYVEDDGEEPFYEKLLKKVVGDSIRISKVFGLGGKSQIIEAARQHVSHPTGNKMLFIADGDFDHILNRNLPQTTILYVLDEYCVENYLFEEKAVHNVIQEEHPKSSIDDIKKKLSMDEWLQETVNGLTPLFACFITIQSENMGIPNANIGIGKFLANSGIPRLDNKKIQAFIDSTKTTYERTPGNVFKLKFDEAINKMGDSWKTRKRHICAKHYLLPLLRFEIKRSFRRDLSPDTMRFRIMNQCQFDSLSDLRKRIEDICST